MYRENELPIKERLRMQKKIKNSEQTMYEKELYKHEQYVIMKKKFDKFMELYIQIFKDSSDHKYLWDYLATNHFMLLYIFDYTTQIFNSKTGKINKDKIRYLVKEIEQQLETLEGLYRSLSVLGL